MKRLKAALFILSFVLLCFWNSVHHGHCAEQNQPQTQSDVSDQEDESKQDTDKDEDLREDPSAVPTIEHHTHTDEKQTQDMVLEATVNTVDEDPPEAEIPEGDPESSVTPEDEADSTNTPTSSLSDGSVTESQSVYDPEDVSSTTTVSPVPGACSDDDDSCSSSTVSPVSPTAACDAGETPPYDAELNSLPLVSENGSTSGPGKSTKAGLGRASQGTNASGLLTEQNVPASTETDAALPSKDAEDIPTFDEWKKIMMEVENEKSHTTHTSSNGGSSGVKKVQKTTNYASVECGAKILASNPEAKSTSAILMENVDVYMLNPCSNKIWFVIELCQPIQVKQLDVANFELFSSTPKDFLVSISDRYPTNKWAKLGTFHARDERVVQSFPLDEHLYAKYVKMFTKYLKVELLSHFGSEHFCPLSLIRVFGTSMMEEYELNSLPSESLNLQDDDDDYPHGCVLSDDQSSKNLIGSAKDAILNMVTNIAANVLGGNPEDGAQGGGNFSSMHLNLTEKSETPSPTISATSSEPKMEHSGTEQHELHKSTQTSTVTEGRDEGPTAPLPSLSETVPLSPEEPDRKTTVEEDQIVTLLPEDEMDESDKTTISRPQNAEKERETSSQDQEKLKVTLPFWEETPDSCTWIVSLEEYLLQKCVPAPAPPRKTSRTRESESQSDTFHKSETSVPFMTSSSLTQDRNIWTVETTSPMTASVPSFPESEHPLKSKSLDLAPSLTSVLLTHVNPETIESKATYGVDLLDLSIVESSDKKSNEKPVKVKNTPILTFNLEPTSTSVATTESEQVAHVQMSVSVTEKPLLTSSSIDQAKLTPSSTSTDQSFVQSNINKSVSPVGTPATAPVTEPLNLVPVVEESKIEKLVDEAVRGENHGGNLPTESYSHGQSVQPSSSDFYAEIPSSTEAPLHGSNQKESVFMRLNNRIKALEVNMSLSGRYLEQLSQRYRKQMEEMQKAFNKTIIKLQNTSRMAEEQDQKQTESIQMLQKHLENVTRIVLNLSLQVSQLQTEVSDRHSYLLLSVLLCFLICIIICVNYCRMSAQNLSTEPDASISNSYSYCCPGRDFPGHEDKNLKRRASYPLSRSSLQIATTEGPNEAYDVETLRNSTGTKKKKRCKIKSSETPQTISPTLLTTLSVPNGGLQRNQHRPHKPDLKLAPHSPGPPLISFRDSLSEGSSRDSSQSDEASFCGIAPCSRICDPLPDSKSRLKKRSRLKKTGTLMEQLLQPVECNGPPVASKFTLHGLIAGATDLSTDSPGVPLLPRQNSFD